MKSPIYASALLDEYNRTRNFTGTYSVPINMGVMTANVATSIFLKARETIQEKIHHFQCYNDKVRANILCQFLTDIFAHPLGGIAFLKYGKMAGYGFPSLQRAFERLDEFVLGPMPFALKRAEKIEISQPSSIDFNFPLQAPEIKGISKMIGKKQST